VGDGTRLDSVIRLFDLPALEQSSKVHAGGRQCGDEVDERAVALQLHPDKTQLVDFRPQKAPPSTDGETAMATTFNFLGFLHVWGKSRKGNRVVRQQTAREHSGPSTRSADACGPSLWRTSIGN
jgi:hypothetical protein